MYCCNKSETVSVCLTMCVSIMFIFSYGKFRSIYPNYKDPLMNSLGLWNLDWWSIIHLTWYAYMGYQYPQCDLLVLGLGVGWEGFEHYLGKSRPAIMGGFGDCPDNINIQNHTHWWYGRFSDMVMNAIGFYTGSMLT